MVTGDFGTGPLSSPSAMLEQKVRAEQIVKNGAGWFLAIAGLSVLNSVLTISGANFHFIFGLGVTEIVDEVGRQTGVTGSTLGLIVNLFIAGLFVLFWKFARTGAKWAFLAGIALYLIDGLILIPFKDFLGVAFHAYALFRIYQGLQGIPALENLRRMTAPADAPIQPA